MRVPEGDLHCQCILSILPAGKHQFYANILALKLSTRLFTFNCVENNFSLQSEKRLLHDSLKDGLEDKIHILEEDKTNVDFTSGLWELNSNKSSRQRRKADPLDPDRRKKPVTVTGPYIVYMLQESEIVDDWTQIKKSLTQRKIIDGKLLSVRWKKTRERFSIWQLYIYTRQAVKNKVNHLFMIVRSQ